MHNRLFSDRLLLGAFYVFLTVFALFCLIPFLLVLSSSLSSETSILLHGYSLFPKSFSTEAYAMIFRSTAIFDAYKVTVFVTVVGTALSLLITSALSYAISVDTIKYRNVIALYVYFTMLFSGGLVPTYILISKYLHMKDTLWVLIIPALITPWYVFLLRSFYKSIPHSLAESAKMDGANDIYILFKIILPLSRPAMATIGLFYALGYWNEWFKALLFIEKPELFPLQYIVMYILRSVDFANMIAAQSGISSKTIVPAYTARMATTIVTIGPIIFVYPLVQKHFVKGLTVGAIKG